MAAEPSVDREFSQHLYASTKVHAPIRKVHAHNPAAQVHAGANPTPKCMRPKCMRAKSWVTIRVLSHGDVGVWPLTLSSAGHRGARPRTTREAGCKQSGQNNYFRVWRTFWFTPSTDGLLSIIGCITRRD